MQVAVITLFPTMIEEFIRHGVLSRSVESGLIEVNTYNPRDFTVDAHRTVDDRPYGGGPGMVMKAEPLQAAIEAASNDLSGLGSQTSNEQVTQKPMACLLYTSPSPRDGLLSRMPSSA